MYFFYIDESGNTEVHHEPLLNGETPLFTLNSICIREDRWKMIDREYHKLKRRFYRLEIGAQEALYYEIKGRKLSSPHNRSNKRDHKFITQVLSLCSNNGIWFFSIIFIKNPSNPTDKNLYIVWRFNI